MHRVSPLRSADFLKQLSCRFGVRSCSYFKHESDKFIGRHIGPREHEKQEMVELVGFQNMEQMIAATVPASIRSTKPLSLSKPLTESQLIQKLQLVADKNDWDWRSFIGMGYYQCHTPAVIVRNVLENPGTSSSVLFLQSSFLFRFLSISLSRQAGLQHIRRTRRRSHRGDWNHCSITRRWYAT